MQFIIYLIILFLIPRTKLFTDKNYKKNFLKNSTLLDITGQENTLHDVLSAADDLDDAVKNINKKNKPPDPELLKLLPALMNAPEIPVDDPDTVVKKIRVKSKKKNFDKIKCEKDEDCNFGECIKIAFDCRCFYGYVTFYNVVKNDTNKNLIKEDHLVDLTFCGYKQKSKFLTLLISIFGLGLEQIYIGNNTIAMYKFCYLFIVLTMSLIYECKCKYHQFPEVRNFCGIIRFILLFGLFYWWFFDIIAIYFNKYKDKYNIELA